MSIDQGLTVSKPLVGRVEQLQIADWEVHCDECIDHRPELIAFDTRMLKAGDIVLSRGLKAHHLIVPYQRHFYPSADHNTWSHVGIYDGVGLVWDVTRSSPVQGHTWTEFWQHADYCNILRYSSSAVDAGELLKTLSYYSSNTTTYRAIISDAELRQLLIARWRGTQPAGNGFIKPDLSQPEGFVCSEFVVRALRSCVGEAENDILPKVAIPLPADFAASSDYFSVGVGWVLSDTCTPGPRGQIT